MQRIAYPPDCRRGQLLRSAGTGTIGGIEVKMGWGVEGAEWLEGGREGMGGGSLVRTVSVYMSGWLQAAGLQTYVYPSNCRS